MVPKTIFQLATGGLIALEDLNFHLRKMDDHALRRFTLATAFLCSPAANSNQPPPNDLVFQLNAARDEARRRKNNLEQ